LARLTFPQFAESVLQFTRRVALTPSADAIVQRIEMIATRDLGIPAGQIQAEVEDGYVVLTGRVEHPEQVRRLVTRAQRVRGVRQVENLLDLPGAPARKRLVLRKAG
jgi:hypothetical protein